MTRVALVSQLDPEFNEFLFAPICDDRNGMMLSVLSALARLDLDPWQEAAKLARLPGEAAARRLAGLIAALPDGPSASLNLRMIAARLITHLPRRDCPDAASHKLLFSVPAAINPWTVTSVLFTVFALAAQLIAAGQQPPAQADKAHASTTQHRLPTTDTPVGR
jgi:hypothetical protein